MLGFGKALTATILGFVSIFFAAIALVMMAESYSYSDDGSLFAGALIVFAGAVAMSVVSLVLGIKSVKLAKTSNPKPIATMVLGIVGICEAGFALFYNFITLIAMAGL